MDAVITWVDGSDPRHIAKRIALRPDRPDAPRSSSHDTRFASLNEIETCLISILKHAPFFRRIFLVTDDQVPACLERICRDFPAAREKIRVVDHREIFHGHEDLLPTFNSTSIETMLFRLPDLDEEFVFFNDDFFILAPVEPADFFRDGRPQLRGKWLNPFKLKVKAYLRGKGLLAPSQSRIDRKELMWRSARLAGIEGRYFFNDHTPHPFLKSRQEQFYGDFPQYLTQNAGHRYRDQSQYNVAALADHLEIAAGHADFVAPRLTYLSPSQKGNSLRYVRRKLARSAREQHQFACVQSLDQCSPEARAMIESWLDAVIQPAQTPPSHGA